MPEEFHPMMGGQGTTSKADRMYDSEEIIIKAKMLESEYVDRAVSLINGASLSMGAKMALASVVYMAFDKNAVLANNPDIDMRVLRFEEALNKAKLSYSRPDVMNPAIVYMHENIRQSFRDFVSRSLNMNERKMQGERKTVMQTNMANSDTSALAQNQPQRKHGFDLIKEKLGMG